MTSNEKTMPKVGDFIVLVGLEGARIGLTDGKRYKITHITPDGSDCPKCHFTNDNGEGDAFYGPIEGRVYVEPAIRLGDRVTMTGDWGHDFGTKYAPKGFTGTLVNKVGDKWGFAEYSGSYLSWFFENGLANGFMRLAKADTQGEPEVWFTQTDPEHKWHGMTTGKACKVTRVRGGGFYFTNDEGEEDFWGAGDTKTLSELLRYTGNNNMRFMTAEEAAKPNSAVDPEYPLRLKALEDFGRCKTGEIYEGRERDLYYDIKNHSNGWLKHRFELIPQGEVATKADAFVPGDWIVSLTELLPARDKGDLIQVIDREGWADGQIWYIDRQGDAVNSTTPESFRLATLSELLASDKAVGAWVVATKTHHATWSKIEAGKAYQIRSLDDGRDPILTTDSDQDTYGWRGDWFRIARGNEIPVVEKAAEPTDDTNGHIVDGAGAYWKARYCGTTNNKAEAHVYTYAEFKALGNSMMVTFKPIAAEPVATSAPTPKYFVGQKVRYTGRASCMTTGRVYEVNRVDEGDEELPIRLIDNGGDGEWPSLDEFEIVTEETVAQPAAAAEPKVKPGDYIYVTDAMFSETDKLHRVVSVCEDGLYVMDSDGDEEHLDHEDYRQPTTAKLMAALAERDLLIDKMRELLK